MQCIVPFSRNLILHRQLVIARAVEVPTLLGLPVLLSFDSVALRDMDVSRAGRAKVLNLTCDVLPDLLRVDDIRALTATAGFRRFPAFIAVLCFASSNGNWSGEQRFSGILHIWLLFLPEDFALPFVELEM